MQKMQQDRQHRYYPQGKQNMKALFKERAEHSCWYKNRYQQMVSQSKKVRAYDPSGVTPMRTGTSQPSEVNK